MSSRPISNSDTDAQSDQGVKQQSRSTSKMYFVEILTITTGRLVGALVNFSFGCGFFTKVRK